MRDDFNPDSLDTVELIMALEGIDMDLSELEEAELSLLLRVQCDAYDARWIPLEAQGSWPATVRVFGQDGQRVLFAVARRVGVGCRNASGVVDAVRLYPSLERALFAFARHECPSA
jgi:hypothetical protein